MRLYLVATIITMHQMIAGCQPKSDASEDQTVTLISVETVDTPPPPPPPPPPRSDFVSLQQWFQLLCENERPDKSIIAYNFGLIQDEKGYTIYLVGSKNYNKDDPDWATEVDFDPNDKYYGLSAAQYKNLKWEQVQEKIIGELKAFTRTTEFRNSFFAKAKAITTGFDDRDLIKIK